MSGQTRIAEGGQIAEQTAPGVSVASTLPWRDVNGWSAIADKNGMFVAHVTQGQSGHASRSTKAKAAFIVRAANSHDALVKALEDVRALIDVPGQPLWSDCRAAVDILNAALASAREVQS